MDGKKVAQSVSLLFKVVMLHNMKLGAFELDDELHALMTTELQILMHFFFFFFSPQERQASSSIHGHNK